MNGLFVYEDITTISTNISSKSYSNILIKNSLTKAGYVFDHATVTNSGGNYCTYAIISLNAYNDILSATIYNPLDGGLSISLIVRIVWKKV